MARPNARHRSSRRSLPPLALGLLVALGAGGVAIAVWGDDTAPVESETSLQVAAPSATSGPTGPGAHTRAATATAAPAPASACRDATEAAEEVVDAARTGIDHWAKHVQARTDLIAGRITEDEMRAIWKATRLAGPEDVAELDQAVAAFEPQAGLCAQVEPSSVPAELSDAMARCLERSEAAATAIASGRSAVADWAAHLENMARFAAGDFDAAHAQHLWEAAWAKAPINIDAFREADQALQSAPVCELAH